MKGPLVVSAIVFWVTPIVLIALAWVISPAYIAPFLNSPNSRVLLIGALLTNSLWCALLAAASHFNWHKAIKTVLGIAAFASMGFFCAVPAFGPGLISEATDKTNLEPGASNGSSGGTTALPAE
jgi:O-antigen ligase